MSLLWSFENELPPFWELKKIMLPFLLKMNKHGKGLEFFGLIEFPYAAKLREIFCKLASEEKNCPRLSSPASVIFVLFNKMLIGRETNKFTHKSKEKYLEEKRAFEDLVSHSPVQCL